MSPPLATPAVPPGRPLDRASGPGIEAFLAGVVRSSAEHTLRLMALHAWPFPAAAAVALIELEILLRLMEEPS